MNDLLIVLLSIRYFIDFGRGIVFWSEFGLRGLNKQAFGDADDWEEFFELPIRHVDVDGRDNNSHSQKKSDDGECDGSSPLAAATPATSSPATATTLLPHYYSCVCLLLTSKSIRFPAFDF